VPLPPTFPIRLASARTLTPSVRELVFERTDGPLAFVPGQWLNLVLPGPSSVDIRRAYSIASPPDGTSRFEIAVTRVENGPASTALHAMAPGTDIHAVGPQGFFTRDADDGTPSLFVGTGTGITPLRSMVRAALSSGAKERLWLLLGVRHEEDILYRAELEELAARHEGFRFVVTLSRPPEGWTGRRGYVQTQLPTLWEELSRGVTEKPQLYVCGLERMVKSVRDVAKKELGIPRERLRSERYDLAALSPTVRPMDDGRSPLVSAAWLAARMSDPALVLVDTRFYLDGRDPRSEYEAGHLPGAVFLDVDGALAGPKGSGPGRHPLPDAGRFAEALAQVGIGPGSTVVSYDDDGGSRAARLWWMLRAYGHPAVAFVLDGGIAAWTAAGHPLSTGPVVRAPVEPFELSLDRARIVDRAEVEALRREPDVVLLDARARERYEGRVEPVDARPGHIPGARNAPYPENLDPRTRTFLSPAELRAKYEALGARPHNRVVVYCGSGVTACHDALALSLIGVDSLLYEGSWSDWSQDPSLPVATGETP
jgi:thiosulfate/3-mercaptopyruvate sulfurtransferase